MCVVCVCVCVCVCCVCVCVCVCVQVEGRVVEVWGGEEGLEEERQRRSSARELRKEKNYAKKVKGTVTIIIVMHYRLRICIMCMCHLCC